MPVPEDMLFLPTMEVETSIEEAIPSSNIPGGRVCILFSTNNANYLCVVDLNAGEICKIRLDYSLGFCVLKNTLYAFDHCDPYMGPNHRRAGHKGQSVYEYDIPSSKFVDFTLEKSMMRRVCRMQGNKSYPKGYVTPDGKILIFSSVITPGNHDLLFNFEMFDPNSGKCTEKLPNPSFYDERRYPDPKELTQIRIISFAFIDQHTLFILSDGKDMLSIDLSKSVNERSWEKWRSFSGIGRMLMPLHGFILLGQDICCLGWNSCFNIVSLEKDTPRNDVGGNEVTCYYTYPGLSTISAFVSGGAVVGGGAAVLGEDGGRVTLCIMKVSLEGRGRSDDGVDVRRICMSLDVYVCDLLECREGIKQDLAKKKIQQIKKKKRIKRSKEYDWMGVQPMILPGMTKVKSLVFRLPPVPLKFFRQENFFTMFLRQS